MTKSIPIGSYDIHNNAQLILYIPHYFLESVPLACFSSLSITAKAHWSDSSMIPVLAS